VKEGTVQKSLFFIHKLFIVNAALPTGGSRTGQKCAVCSVAAEKIALKIEELKL
jgi:hypothetical protein